MSKSTYYVVQTWRDMFVRKAEPLGYYEGVGVDKAGRFSLGEAMRLHKQYAREQEGGDTPRRFPRILKVTQEVKTITPNRKGV